MAMNKVQSEECGVRSSKSEVDSQKSENTMLWIAPWTSEVRRSIFDRVILSHAALRTFSSAAWLGWQIETNWTSPWVFLIYVLLKPLAGSMLLVCMYWAASAARGGAVEPGYLPYLFISSTCFMVIGGVTYGMSTSVVTDR